jgi:hypothetical protein
MIYDFVQFFFYIFFNIDTILFISLFALHIKQNQKTIYFVTAFLTCATFRLLFILYYWGFGDLSNSPIAELGGLEVSLHDIHALIIGGVLIYIGLKNFFSKYQAEKRSCVVPILYIVLPEFSELLRPIVTCVYPELRYSILYEIAGIIVVVLISAKTLANNLILQNIGFSLLVIAGLINITNSLHIILGSAYHYVFLVYFCFIIGLGIKNRSLY